MAHLKPDASSIVQSPLCLRDEDGQPKNQQPPVVLVVRDAHGFHLLCSHQLGGGAVTHVVQVHGASENSFRNPA